MSWQVRTGQTFSTIVNCSFATNKCIHSEPRKYTGRIVSSTNTNRTVNLQINDIKRNETEFECEVDKKLTPSPCIVEVYGKLHFKYLFFTIYVLSISHSLRTPGVLNLF